jgi:hypothetical protein
MLRYSLVSKIKKEISKPTTERIERDEIEFLINVNEDIQRAEAEIELLKKIRDLKQVEIYLAIRSGAKTDHLPWLIEPEISFRTYPAWKEILISVLGTSKAEELAKKTKKTKYLDVVIKEKIQNFLEKTKASG